MLVIRKQRVAVFNRESCCLLIYQQILRDLFIKTKRFGG